jgi:hypothetical protein
MHLNHDGASGEFLDTSVRADTTNIAQSAVYASIDSMAPIPITLRRPSAR